MAIRRHPKPQTGPVHGSGHYVRQIIKCLDQVHAVSGYHAHQIFDDWTQLVEACLTALPAHLTSMAQTGRLAADTPETKQLFARIRSRYDQQPYRSNAASVWSLFSQAFALLLESAEPGLWGPNSYGNPSALRGTGVEVGSMGPDVIGQVYLLYATPNLARGQIFTPWNLALLLGRLNIPDGERQVLDRLKQACQHPDNVLAQAALLAGLAITDPDQAREWFFTRVLPLARTTYQPIRVGDPAGCGSGVLLLAAAACFPEWAVRLGYVVFEGVDVDPGCVRFSKINCMLYSLNGYALKLETAAAEALAAHRLRSGDSAPALPPAPAEAIRQVYRNGRAAPPGDGSSFEAMFRAAVGRAPAVAEAA